MSHTPPSMPKQKWGLLALVFALSFIGLIILQTLLIWPEQKWGGVNRHLEWVAKATWQLLSQDSSTLLAQYVFQLKSLGIYSEMKITISIAFLLSFAASALISYRIVFVPGGKNKLVKVNGPTLYKGKSVKKGLRDHHRKNNQKSSVAIHPDLLLTPKELEGNIFAFGQHGSGKSVILKQLLQQIINANQQIIIYDEKREYTELFYDPKDTLLIAPWDKRSAHWDIAKDLKRDEDFELIAQRLIPANTKDPMWSNGARAILAGVLAICNAENNDKWSWDDIAKTLSKDDFTLRILFEQHYIKAARYIEKNSKTTHGFMSTLLTDVSWLYSLAKYWQKSSKKSFSLRDWVNGNRPDIKKIIIQSHPEFKEVGAPLCNSILGFITSLMLAKPDNHNTLQTWLIIDELGNLPKNDSLKEWLSLGRSKGCRFVGGTQSISQLHDKYGEHDTNTLLNLFATVIALRCGAPGGEAEYAANCFGEAIYERPSSGSTKMGASAISWQREISQLVTASDLVHLPQSNDNGVTGYIASSGWNSVFQLQWPYPKLDKQAPSHIPSPWVLDTTQRPQKRKNGRLGAR
ncbi:type IV secretion system DNA-binding domain-containing protein [Vibrio sp. 10N.222.55.A3]|uniref:type IV secretion system DNA-binding domain-containing protein n=1 Tax=unclassified Vibrio TaxID=2614977 RepID=UPI003551A2DC